MNLYPRKIAQKFGNCPEYATQTQKIGIKKSLKETFILFGFPEHIFNVTVEGDKIK